jgi:hypothetical protein
MTRDHVALSMVTTIASGTIAFLSSILVVLRLRVAWRPPWAPPSELGLLLGALYWMSTIPLLGWIWLLFFFWNGVPG